MTTATAIIIGIVCVVLGAIIGMLFSKSSLNAKAKFIIQDAKKNAENLIEKATVQAESIKKERHLQRKVSRERIQGNINSFLLGYWK